MKQYRMDLITYYENPRDGDTTDKILKCHITERSEECARRKALLRAWNQGLVVKKFLSITTKAV